MLVDDVAHDGIEDGVAKKFEPLIVHWLPFLVAVHDALVHQGHLVITDIVGIESDDLVQRQIKLLILAERELYPVNNVIQHTS